MELPEKSGGELLAEETGRPVEEFEIDEEAYPTPELDELELVDREVVH